MKLSILILALRSRPWGAIYSHLKEQASKFPEEVEVIVDLDNGEATSGIKRQRTVEKAKGEYACFVDDDDRVSQDYVEAMLDGCRRGVDVVTFNLSMRNRNKTEVWKFGLWPNQRANGLMCVNHLCAWRKSLATQVGWCPSLGYGDDQVWFQPLFHSGLVKTEHHIDRILYLYQFDWNVTANQQPQRREYAKRYVGSGLRCFFDSDRRILVEVGECPKFPESVVVRDRDNIESCLTLSSLTHFHTIQIS